MLDFWWIQGKNGIQKIYKIEYTFCEFNPGTASPIALHNKQNILKIKMFIKRMFIKQNYLQSLASKCPQPPTTHIFCSECHPSIYNSYCSLEIYLDRKFNARNYVCICITQRFCLIFILIFGLPLKLQIKGQMRIFKNPSGFFLIKRGRESEDRKGNPSHPGQQYPRQDRGKQYIYTRQFKIFFGIFPVRNWPTNSSRMRRLFLFNKRESGGSYF